MDEPGRGRLFRVTICVDLYSIINLNQISVLLMIVVLIIRIFLNSNQMSVIYSN
jgi:hypothetical protein